MIGAILFLLSYVIAAILLYTVIFKTYEKSLVKTGYTSKYVVTETDKRHKYPLWLILIGLCIFFIPVINIIAYVIFMIMYSECNNVYYKSFFSKKF